MARIDQFRTLQIVKALLLYRYLYELSRRQQLNKQVDLEPDPKTASGGYAQKAETPIKRSSPFGGSAISFPANLAKNPRQTIYYYHHDHLGSVRVVTDASGQPVDRYNYFPFGQEINSQPNAKTNYKFTGKEHDSSTNLDYFGRRYYSSNLYRWTSIDPITLKKKALINPQSWNLYNYCLNNPTKYLDPDGNAEESIIPSIFIITDPIPNKLTANQVALEIAHDYNRTRNVQEGEEFRSYLLSNASTGNFKAALKDSDFVAYIGHIAYPNAESPLSILFSNGAISVHESLEVKSKIVFLGACGALSEYSVVPNMFNGKTTIVGFQGKARLGWQSYALMKFSNFLFHGASIQEAVEMTNKEMKKMADDFNKSHPKDQQIKFLPLVIIQALELF